MPGIGPIKITLGWSLPTHSDFRIGQRSFTLSPPSTVESQGNLPDVEGPRGLLFQEPTSAQFTMNADLERLIADHLLLFMHYAFWNQGKDAFYGRSVEPETLLVMGPVLPKFRGRTGYLMFDRKKTLAIIAPDCLPGQTPATRASGWRKLPSPPYWHDAAVRTYSRDGARAARPPGITSFEIVAPIADTFPAGRGRDNSAATRSRGGDSLAAGTALLEEKARSIQEIIDSRVQPARPEVWAGAEVNLPRGMACAANATCLEQLYRTCDNRSEGISADLAKEIQASVGNSGVFPGSLNSTQQKRRRILMMSVAEKAAAQDVEPGGQTLAARGAVRIGRGLGDRTAKGQGRGLGHLVDKSAKELRNDFGEGFFSDAE